MKEAAADYRTRIPSITRLVPLVNEVFSDPPIPHSLAVKLARAVASGLRQDPKSILDETLVRRIADPLLKPGPKTVINGTGILLHTNLGRSPLDEDVVLNAFRAVRGYTNLELDLAKGSRGHRDRHFAQLAQLLWNVEDATIVNNAAAAVGLTLSALGGGRETVVSRGELIEIGGSFRLPDIMTFAGTKLVEVGTTNKTKLADYQKALAPATGCLLKTHPSNYRVEGFTKSVTLADLAALGRKSKVPVVMDLGSGLSESLNFPPVSEPSIESYLADGPDLLIFSGDKLFGSVQAGIVLGRANAVAQLRKHPMMRMVRSDKLTISMICHQLAKTAMCGTNRLADLASTSPELLRQRAQRVVTACPQLKISLSQETAFMGGGSLPCEQRPTLCLVVQPKDPERFALGLRQGEPAVVGYLRKGRFLLDLSTVPASQDKTLITALQRCESH